MDRIFVVRAVRCVEYAILNGAHVINASWGGSGHSLLLRDAILAAQEEGIIFVAAAGNDDGSDNDLNPRYPASMNFRILFQWLQQARMACWLIFQMLGQPL